MEAFLIVISGAKRARLPLKLPTIIGRSDDSNLKVKAAAISRRHCELYEYEGELAVKDLGSSNGTFVNDVRIDVPAFLSPGDELRVGKVTFQADYELPEKTPLDEEVEVLADAGEAPGDESSHVQLHNTEEGSFISIDTGKPTADKPDSQALGEFFQGLD